MAELPPELTGLLADVERQVAPPPFGTLVRRAHLRRRRRHATVAACAAAVMVGGVTIGVEAMRGPDQTPRGVDALATQLIAVEAEPPKDFPFSPTDVEFVDARTGYLIGLACSDGSCTVAVRRTDDGGETWGEEVVVDAAVPHASVRQQKVDGGGARSLRFVTARHGYAFNPALYETFDGGMTWTHLGQPAGKVLNFSAPDGTEPWQLLRGCARGRSCDITVAGTTSRLADPQLEGTDGLLRRRDPDRAWALAWHSASGEGTLRRTTDGGRSWLAATDPCPGAEGRQLQVSPDGALWAVCAGDLPTVRRSRDGGATWATSGTLPVTAMPTDVLPLSGSTAYVATMQVGRLLRTTDGGRTWHRAAGTTSGYGFTNVQFVDATHGWAMGDRGVLWRTTDGVRWERLDLPVGEF